MLAESHQYSTILSTCSIVKHKPAGWLGLKDREVEQWLEVAGKEYECLKTKQQEELRLIKENVIHDADNNGIRLTYPITGYVTKL